MAFDGDWKKAKIAEADYTQVVRRRRRPLRQDALDAARAGEGAEEARVVESAIADC